MKKTVFLTVVAALALGLSAASPAQARAVSHGPAIETPTDQVILVKGGGRGWAKGNRGRHYGWQRGRGKAWGRKARFGR